MSVQTDLVREHLVGSLLAAAKQKAAQPMPEGLEQAVTELVADPDDRGRARREAELAHLGYLARAVEVERFAPARSPMPWLEELLAGGATERDVARGLADEEPDGRPDPADDAPSWRVPGPGGHVRHYVALAAIAETGEDQAADVPALKRCWLFGFFWRCCEEATEQSSSD